MPPELGEELLAGAPGAVGRCAAHFVTGPELEPGLVWALRCRASLVRTCFSL